MTSPILRAQKYLRGKPLGNGAYGVVTKITVTEGEFKDKDFALKEMFINKGSIEKEDGEREYYILKQNIPNVVRAYGSEFDSAAQLFRFSMELYKGGNLKQFVEEHQNSRIPFRKFMSIFRDIVTGYKFSSSRYKHKISYQVYMGFGERALSTATSSLRIFFLTKMEKHMWLM